MKTLDGYELEEGDDCWVSCQDPHGVGRLSPEPREAVYLNEAAKQHGWDFHIKNLRFYGEIEIVAVWKHYPGDQHRAFLNLPIEKRRQILAEQVGIVAKDYEVI